MIKISWANLFHEYFRVSSWSNCEGKHCFYQINKHICPKHIWKQVQLDRCICCLNNAALHFPGKSPQLYYNTYQQHFCNLGSIDLCIIAPTFQRGRNMHGTVHVNAMCTGRDTHVQLPFMACNIHKTLPSTLDQLFALQKDQ